MDNLFGLFGHKFWIIKSPDFNGDFDPKYGQKATPQKIRNSGHRPWEGCTKTDTKRDCSPTWAQIIGEII